MSEPIEQSRDIWRARWEEAEMRADSALSYAFKANGEKERIECERDKLREELADVKRELSALEDVADKDRARRKDAEAELDRVKGERDEWRESARCNGRDVEPGLIRELAEVRNAIAVLERVHDRLAKAKEGTA